MNNRPIEINIARAGHYFRRLGDFLGKEGIDKRLAKIDRQINSASGFYLNDWVIPRASWWLGFKEAREVIKRNGSFRRSFTVSMDRPLQTAVKLSSLHKSLTESKRREFRSRFLANDVIEPTLFEIDVAGHFMQLGYEIEWFEARSDIGERTPEFIAKKKSNEIEVECKAKSADAGRRIERASFYRLIDLLFPIIENKGLTGRIFIEVPSRLPRKDEWFLEAQQTFEANVTQGKDSLTLSGEEKVEYDLKKADSSAIHVKELIAMVDPVTHPYSHSAIKGYRRNDMIYNPIVFKLDSRKRDRFLDRVLESLRNAQDQFTGDRSALICCMIPEIESFEGLQSDSAIKEKTLHFFEKYSLDCVNAVSYVSEIIREEGAGVINYDMPSLAFRNHKYNQKFGPDIQIYEKRS